MIRGGNPELWGAIGDLTRNTILGFLGPILIDRTAALPEVLDDHLLVVSTVRYLTSSTPLVPIPPIQPIVPIASIAAFLPAIPILLSRV